MRQVTMGILYNPTTKKILIGQRKENKPFPGYFEFPGGKLEYPETLYESLKRELNEELNLSIKKADFLFKIIREDFTLYFFFISDTFKPLIDNEYDIAYWISIKALKEYNFLPHNLPLIPLLESHEDFLTKILTKQRRTPIQEETLLKIQINDNLFLWYDLHKRTLPFRATKNPYYILLSEIMLQQTQMQTVIPYFHRFIDTYPTLEALSKGDEETVLKLWEGLGYYSRGRNLLKCAQKVSQDFNGKLPTNFKDLKTLPGIGDYTAGAIASIAFGEKTPAVDGNLLRVFSRLFGIKKDISQMKTKTYFQEKIKAIMSEKRPGDFNEAIMDLGSLICTKKNPACLNCPFSPICVANNEGLTHELPINKKKIVKEVTALQVGFVTYGDYVLFEKRPEKGLLANLYGLPAAPDLKKYFFKTYDTTIQLGESISQKSHQFTHKTWHMTLYPITLPDKIKTVDTIWVKKDNLESLSIPTAFKKLL